MTKLISGILGPVGMVGLISVVALFMGPEESAGIKARPGAPAPAFIAQDIRGQIVSLADYRGKTVILEWTNDGCPFVGKHYNSGNMQALQRRFTQGGDIWLTIA